MSSVGTHLRELRQRRGVSIEEIARTTRVAQRYLESIEADAFDALPSPVFTRGFIRAYCQALGEPPDEALAAFEGRESRAATGATAQPPTAPLRPGRPSLPRPAAAGETEPRGKGAVLVSFVLLVVLGVALFGVALVIHPRDRSERVTAASRPEPRAESRPVRGPEEPAAAPSPASAPRPSPPAPGTPPSAVTTSPATSAPAVPGALPPTAALPRPAPAAPGAPATGTTAPPVASPPVTTPPLTAPPVAASAPRPAPAAPGAPAAGTTAPPAPAQSAAPSIDAIVGSVVSPYRLVARTNETTWIRVRTEDGRTSEENVPPGEIREWISNRPFTLTIGNAGGVSFELNGRALPPLGPKGAVIQRIVLPPDAR